MNQKEQTLKEFERLLEIMDTLREKCPWDRKQTFASLRHLTIEEVYELSDSIASNDLVEVKKELGDILLHIVFYAKIASESDAFDMYDVLHGICGKLIHRHPHIYGDVKVANEEDVKQNWEKLKLKEGSKSVLGGVPVSLPSLIKSMRIQEKAAAVGFDWEHREQVWSKVEEEMQELSQVVQDSGVLDRNRAEDEFGDLMFALVNYARFLKISPEDALERTNRKFMSRFTYIESKARQRGVEMDTLTLEQMDDLWNEAKRLEAK